MYRLTFFIQFGKFLVISPLNLVSVPSLSLAPGYSRYTYIDVLSGTPYFSEAVFIFVLFIFFPGKLDGLQSSSLSSQSYEPPLNHLSPKSPLL